MKIVKVPSWLDTRHHLLDADGNVVCKTDSLLVVQFWRTKYNV